MCIRDRFRGFARAAEGLDNIDATALRNMRRQGADTAYKAIMKPKEGTILTVIRVIAEDVEAAFRPDWDLIDMMGFALGSGDAILRRTTDMLPALKQSCVVDSGGKGLCVVLAGFLSALKGEHIDAVGIEAAPAALPGDFVDDHAALEEITFGYCTEFIVSHPNEDCTDAAVTRFRNRLETVSYTQLMRAGRALRHMRAVPCEAAVPLRPNLRGLSMSGGSSNCGICAQCHAKQPCYCDITGRV